MDYVNDVGRYLELEALVVVWVQGVLLDGSFLLKQTLGALRDADLDVWICKYADVGVDPSGSLIT